MRGIAAGLANVGVMVAGLGLCLAFAAYDAVKQGFSAASVRGSVAATGEPPASR